MTAEMKAPARQAAEPLNDGQLENLAQLLEKYPDWNQTNEIPRLLATIKRDREARVSTPRTSQEIGDIVTRIIGEWPHDVIAPTRPTIKAIVESTLALAPSSQREQAVRELVEAVDDVLEDYRPITGGGSQLMDRLRSAAKAVKGTE